MGDHAHGGATRVARPDDLRDLRVNIDVFHDTVCPWCRIGLRNLELALAEWDGEPIAVRLHPFQLDPSLPAEGIALADYFRARGIDDPAPMYDRVREVGRQAGLTFLFAPGGRMPNTLASHQLVGLAGERADDVLAAIHRAYFEEGRDIGDPAVLAELAAEAGLDPAAVAGALADPAARAEVAEAAEEGRKLGITGVPFFVVDGKLAVSGAQPPERLRDALRQSVETARR